MPTGKQDTSANMSSEQEKLSLSERLNALFTGDARTIENLRKVNTQLSKSNVQLEKMNKALLKERDDAQAMLEDIEGAVKKREAEK